MKAANDQVGLPSSGPLSQQVDALVAALGRRMHALRLRYKYTNKSKLVIPSIELQRPRDGVTAGAPAESAQASARAPATQPSSASSAAGVAAAGALELSAAEPLCEPSARLTKTSASASSPSTRARAHGDDDDVVALGKRWQRGGRAR